MPARLQAEVDDFDAPPPSRPRSLLQGLGNHRPRGIRVVDAEHGDRLTLGRVGDPIDQVARGAGCVALAGHERAVVALRPAGLLEDAEVILLSPEQDFVKLPDWAPIVRNRTGAEFDRCAVDLVERSARIADQSGDLAIFGFVVGQDRGEILPGQRLPAGCVLYEGTHAIIEIALREDVIAAFGCVSNRFV